MYRNPNTALISATRHNPLYEEHIAEKKNFGPKIPKLESIHLPHSKVDSSLRLEKISLSSTSRVDSPQKRRPSHSIVFGQARNGL